MRENKFSNHPFEYKKPTEPRITYLFLSLVRGYFVMETGSISATSANDRQVNEHVWEGRIRKFV